MACLSLPLGRLLHYFPLFSLFFNLHAYISNPFVENEPSMKFVILINSMSNNNNFLLSLMASLFHCTPLFTFFSHFLILFQNASPTKYIPLCIMHYSKKAPNNAPEMEVCINYKPNTKPEMYLQNGPAGTKPDTRYAPIIHPIYTRNGTNQYLPIF